MAFKRILVAIDESKTSQIAFKEAINFIKPLHAKLCIFHVIEKLPDHIAYAIDVIKYQKLANEKAEKLLNKFLLLARKNKIPSQSQLVEIVDFKNSIANELLKKIKTWKPDLVVLGTHGRKGFSHLVLGSVAEEVIKTSPVPVLVVNSKKTANCPKR